MRFWLFVAVTLGGCTLPGKEACRTADDCLDGRACVDAICVAGGADLANDLGADVGDMTTAGDLPAATCTPASCAQGTCEAGACLPGRWATAAPMPTARHGLAAVFAGDGRLYALGGYASGSGAVVEAYDPTGDAWSSVPAMPHARAAFGAVVGSDGRIYAVGGPYASVSDAGVSHLVDAYAPAQRTWSAAPSLATGRSDVAAVVGSDGSIYAVAGFDSGTFAVTDSVEKLSGAQWTAVAAHLLTARQDHAAVALADGRIFALGGVGGFSGPPLDAVESLPAGGNAFSSGKPLTSARSMTAAVVAGGRIYVLGGLADAGGTAVTLSRVEAYDPATQAWTRVASLPTARYALAAATGPDGKIYVVGGHDGTHPVAALEVLTP